MVYLGSLFVFLAQSIFSIDEFSGTIVREPTLATLAELFRPANFDILMRTVGIAAAVTLLSAVIGFPMAYYAARYAGPRAKAAFDLAVMMPLWSSYLVKIYGWKLLLAKEGAMAGSPGASASGRRWRRGWRSPLSAGLRSRSAIPAWSWCSPISGCPS